MDKATLENILSAPGEYPGVDFKCAFDWAESSNDLRQKVVKSIMGMANIQDGGALIIGINNDNFSLDPLTASQAKSFDSTTINQFLQKYCDPSHSCSLQKVEVPNGFVIVIETTEFEEEPIVCAKDANSPVDGKSILRKGAIYVRTNRSSTEEISDSKQVRKLLGRALKKKSNEFLESIREVIEGRNTSFVQSYDFLNEIEDAVRFFDSGIGKTRSDRGFWQLLAYPVIKGEPERVEKGKLKNCLEQSIVLLRGWDFPHIRRDQFGSFERGLQSSIEWEQGDISHVEAFRIYETQLFASRILLGEEGLTRREDKFLEPVWTVLSLTEFLIFFTRFYELLGVDEIELQISLNGMKDRTLKAYRPTYHVIPSKCQVDKISFVKRMTILDLRSSLLGQTQEIFREILHMFNKFDDMDNWDRFVARWQEKLMTRTL